MGILPLAMGLSNLPRSHAGIGVLLAAVIIACVKLWPTINADGKRPLRTFLRLPITLCAILFGYSLFTATIPSLYQSFTKQPPRVGNLGPGHALYVGIGWEDNPYGITFLDKGALEATDNAGAETYGYSANPVYSARIMQLYLDLVKADPVYFIGSYRRKLIACTKLAFAESKTVRNFVLWKVPRFFILLLVGTALAILTTPARQKKTLMLHTLCLAGIWLVLFGGSLLPAMIAVPRWTYLNGAIGALDALVFLMVMLLISRVLHNAWALLKNYDNSL